MFKTIFYLDIPRHAMFRLNSGNFWIVYPDEFYFNLNIKVKSVLKIIENDTDIVYELYNFPTENQLFNFCVGGTVGGKPPEVSRVFSGEFGILSY